MHVLGTNIRRASSSKALRSCDSSSARKWSSLLRTTFSAKPHSDLHDRVAGMQHGFPRVGKIYTEWKQQSGNKAGLPQ